MKTWSDTIDPATIPDEVLLAERARRNNAKILNRTGGSNGGRPLKLFVCEHCGAKLLGRAAADAHQCA